MFIGLIGRKDIKNIDIPVRRPDPVHAPHALQYAGGVPGQIVVNDDIRALQVNALGQNIRAQQYPHIVPRAPVLRLIIGLDRLSQIFFFARFPPVNAAVAVKGKHFILKVFVESGLQIFDGFPGLAEDQNLAVF